MLKKTLATAAILVLGFGLNEASAQTNDPNDPYDNDPATANDPTPGTTNVDVDVDRTDDPDALPETASLWPLVGMIGLGSVSAGLILRRRRA